MLEKLQGFSEKKFQMGGTGQEIVNAYEEKRGDAREQVEALSIIKRQHTTGEQPTCPHLVAENIIADLSLDTSIVRTGLGASGLNRQSSASTGTSSLGVGRNPSIGGASLGRAGSTATSTYSSIGAKKMPPPPPSSVSAGAPPPPYTSGGAATAAAAAKRAPPPPPVKPKPAAAAPPVEYVTALYDYEAQAEGDLSFKAGDRIELVEKSENAEDWWTGRLRGAQGVFPGELFGPSLTVASLLSFADLMLAWYRRKLRAVIDAVFAATGSCMFLKTPN